MRPAVGSKDGKNPLGRFVLVTPRCTDVYTFNGLPFTFQVCHMNLVEGQSFLHCAGPVMTTRAGNRSPTKREESMWLQFKAISPE